MKFLSIFFLLALTACSSTENETFCDADKACPGELFCDIDGAFGDKITNTCIDKPNPTACNRVQSCPAETHCSDDMGGECVECLVNTDCGLLIPVCDSDNHCSGCETNSDCASLFCQGETNSCEPTENIIYVDVMGSQDVDCGTIENPCSSYSFAIPHITPSRQTLLFLDGEHIVSSSFSKTLTVLGQGQSTLRGFLSVTNNKIQFNNIRIGASMRCTDSLLSLSEVVWEDSQLVGGSTMVLDQCVTSIFDSIFRNNDSANTIEVIGGQLTITGVLIDSNSGYGVRAEPEGSLTTPSVITITNSTISNNEFGVRAVFSDVTVRDSTIEKNSRSGINLFESDYSISNNFISENGAFGVVAAFARTPAKGQHVEQITFNTFVANSSSFDAVPAALFCRNANTEAHSNIFFGPVTTDDVLVDESCAPTYSLFSEGDVFVAGTGNLQANPLFVDIAGGDYHLQSDSPCINKGNPFALIETDIDGDLRETSNSSPDIGADEYKEAQ